MQKICFGEHTAPENYISRNSCVEELLIQNKLITT